MRGRLEDLIRASWIDYREAASAFSAPARCLLVSRLIGWASLGINQVLFNLYLLEAGFGVTVVGHSIALYGAGIASVSLPAGSLARRYGRARCLVLGTLVLATGLLARAIVVSEGIVAAASFVAGAGQAMLVIAAAPFLSEHSTPRERTHLFSVLFAVELVSALLGTLLGGALPHALEGLAPRLAGDHVTAYRAILVVSAVLSAAAAWPLSRLLWIVEPGGVAPGRPREGAGRALAPIAVNAFVIGAGAGLIVPFMNLYFKARFDCSSAQIGVFFSVGQVLTAVTGLIVPVAAERAGALRAAAGLQFASLPFLVMLGLEHNLAIAVVAFWARAALMQASTPLHSAFIMSVLPPEGRPRAASVGTLCWNLGWALSALTGGFLIQHGSVAIPFYVTAGLYAGATTFFYASFRRVAPKPPSTLTEARLPQRASRPSAS